MILDTMTYLVMAVIAALSVVVFRLANISTGQQDNKDK